MSALYTSIEAAPVDIRRLCSEIEAISDINEGLCKFCQGIMDRTLHVEDAASMSIILAAIAAVQKHLGNIYPEVAEVRS